MRDTAEIMQTAIQAIKRGDTYRGVDLIVRVIKLDPSNEHAWLWLSAVVATTEEKRYCLEMVREMNPDNFNAKAGLVMLGPGAAQRPTEVRREDEHVGMRTLDAVHPSRDQSQGNTPVLSAPYDPSEIRGEPSSHGMLVLTIILVFLIIFFIAGIAVIKL